MSGNRTRRKNNRAAQQIQHHHFLSRIESAVCPSKEDQAAMRTIIKEIIADIGMTPLGQPFVSYVSDPKNNEGLSAVQVITTSHLAMHFWKNPDKSILQGDGSRCLLQLDCYTCGSLTPTKIRAILLALARFDPRRADITLFNRKMSLKLESHDHWNYGEESWVQWVERRF